MTTRSIARSMLLAGTALVAGAATASAAPTYALLTTLAVPSAGGTINPSGVFSTYDIGTFDDSTQTYYLADRSNAGVDVYSSATNSFITRIPGFAGIGSSTAVSGPDGVVTVNLPGQHSVYAGDANSLLKGFSISGTATSPVYTPLANTPINTGGGQFRVDEMSFDPVTKTLLAANNANTPPFTTLVNTTTNTVIAKTVYDGTNGTPNATTGGIEASVYNAKTGTFFISIPQIGTSGPGGVSEVNPSTGAVIRTIDFASFGLSACSPAGITASSSGNILVGCGVASQTVILNSAGQLVATIPNASGADEVDYSPTTNLYFLADRSDPTGPQLAIIDASTNTLLQNIPTVAGAHSVAVDPVTGEVFVPLGGPNSICANGCIGVYAPVPEPSSMALFVSAFAGLLGFAGWRRRT